MDRQLWPEESVPYAILDALPIAVFVLDGSGSPFYANAEAQRLLGKGILPDVRTDELSEVYDAFLRSSTEPYPTDRLPIVRALQGESCHVDDMELRLPDGRVIPLEVWGAPLVAGGTVRYAVAAFADVTARVRAEASFDLLRRATVAANEAATLEEAVRRCLADVCDHTGWPVGHVYLAEGDEVVPSGIWHLADPERFEGFVRRTAETRFARGAGLIGTVAARGEAVWVPDVTRHAGYERATEGSAYRVRAAFAFPMLVGAEVVGVLEFYNEAPAEPDPQLLAVMQQVGIQLGRAVERERERRAQAEAMEALLLADDMKNAFLGALSHDLRNPLASILGSAELLARADLPAEQLRELASTIYRQAQRMDRMLMSLLDVERLQHHALESRREPTELEPLVRRIVRDVSLEDRVEVGVAGVVASVDPSQVERIVENLVWNAVKYTPEDALIAVRASRGPEGVELRVEDSGPGVPADVRHRIFSLFDRGVASSTTQGLGIGLALVSRFAQMHGGRAWVSDRPGGGAVFHVLFPDEAPAAGPVRPERP